MRADCARILRLKAQAVKFFVLGRVFSPRALDSEPTRELSNAWRCRKEPFGALDRLLEHDAEGLDRGAGAANLAKPDRRVSLENLSKPHVASRHFGAAVESLSHDRVERAARPRGCRREPCPKRMPGEPRGIEPGASGRALHDVRDGITSSSTSETIA